MQQRIGLFYCQPSRPMNINMVVLY